MKFEKHSISFLIEALETLEEGFAHLPDVRENIDKSLFSRVMQDMAIRMQNNYPYFHPLYAGQMLRPPHPVAKAAYMLAMWINPNNHALDGGRESSAMEKEVVSDLANMIGWKEHLGHLTGGGTMANLEALWVADQIHHGKMIVASDQAHYTHARISEVLKIPFASVPTDGWGRMDLNALESKLKTGRIGTVVVTMGTTSTGAVDPLADILALQKTYAFRIHIDAAYGGYFKLIRNLEPPMASQFELIHNADSFVIDPHKHGLQPYGCGCILFKDPAAAKYYLHDSPYTYFTSEDLHLGEISLECSRAGAAAVALWTTHQYFPLKTGGAFAERLEKSREAALNLYQRLNVDDRFLTLYPPDTDIVIWAIKGKDTIEISHRTRRFFKVAEENHLSLALLKLSTEKVRSFWPDIRLNSDQVTLLRSCLMRPEQLDWMEVIWKKIVDSNSIA